MPALYALIDCNAFFVSCERVFQPGLRRKPVVVLSSNDGCVIARSPEAKTLGIPMGEPAFRLRDMIAHKGLITRSSNFALYTDISNRVMATLGADGFQQEVYSIDECFLDIAPADDPAAWAHATRARVLQHTGIPTSIGIAPTKTLAKLANEHAKKAAAGVFLLPPAGPERDRFLASQPVNAVWGVGAQTAPQLEQMGLRTALDLARADPVRVRARCGLGTARTAQELAGLDTLAMDEVPHPPQSITVSRSFGASTSARDDLRAAVAAFVENAAAKARQQGVVASTISVWLMAKEPAADGALSLTLNVPTALAGELQAAASSLVTRLYRPGISYRKAGVGLVGLQVAGTQQQSFLDHVDRPRAERLQAAVDAINAQEGRRVVQTAATLLSQAWRPSAQQMSPRFTTRWEEMPVAR